MVFSSSVLMAMQGTGTEGKCLYKPVFPVTCNHQFFNLNNHLQQTNSSTTQTTTQLQKHHSTMESVKQAANYVSETVQGTLSGASKEANKEVAKDNNVDVSTR